MIPALAAMFSKLNGLTCFLAPLLPTPQIHATLALAAATAPSADRDFTAWNEATRTGLPPAFR